jgi:hypothetical protein
VSELKIQEQPPSTLRNIDGGSRGGVEAGDPGVPTINVKNVDDRPLGRPPQGGGSGPHPGSKRCVVNLHRHDRQKVILLTGPTIPALGPVMADDTESAYGACVIQCDTIYVMVMPLFMGM